MFQKKILVIDDQDDLRFILCFDLKKQGYDVLSANCGEKGIESARESRPDLIILDRKMPLMDGLETCRRLKADPATKDIPVLILSGKSQRGELDEALQAGAADYVIKPFQFDELMKKIHGITETDSKGC
ncbi:MAG: response regulator [Candidatus Aureabacteria bacterium]|nr:response regulator [Candidatus Auribacterota bacterium]